MWIDVLQCVSDTKGTRSACINAASLALADAGIPMRDLVTSCSAGYLNSTALLGKFFWFFVSCSLSFLSEAIVPREKGFLV